LKNLPADHKFVVEIRNKNWLDAKFADVLREHRVGVGTNRHVVCTPTLGDEAKVRSGYSGLRFMFAGLETARGLEKQTHYVGQDCHRPH